MYRNYILIILLATFFSSCGPTIRYLGNYETPTDHSKVYFREADIDKEYEVIGRIYVKFSESANTEKVQKAVTAKAMKVGGNGVIMSELQEKQKAVVTNTASSGTAVGKKNKAYVGGSASKSTVVIEDEIECQVIKFKK